MTVEGRTEQSASADSGPSAVVTLVQRLHDMSFDDDKITLDRLAREIGAQGHAPLLMVIAVFMILPIGMIPGIGGALGALVALIGLQMLRGREGVWVPEFLGRREVPGNRIRSAMRRIQPAAEWVKRRLHPRWVTLADGQVSLTVIAVILILAGGSLIVLGAIPIATPLIGLPVAIMAFGILGRDGVVVAAGYALIGLTFGAVLLLRGGGA
ncbi:exopolysaccharide biosynthesis protein [Tritonibacter horizontis]|uniref:Exopolysaccharide synthesis, ExoD n=1 Tax=Tritonibacter horizontis TaxID=1768241 RepID=A0A132C233_9RHOB|nr:exopolysaccharide biosynthesis protein [Tritonibacter horizontis]KUP94658.1 exopolysaccharide synthesis, ExoD [Tritonibacter horizontis]